MGPDSAAGMSSPDDPLLPSLEVTPGDYHIAGLAAQRSPATLSIDGSQDEQRTAMTPVADAVLVMPGWDVGRGGQLVMATPAQLVQMR